MKHTREPSIGPNINRGLLLASASLLLLFSTSGCFAFVNLDLTGKKSPYEEVVLEESESWWTGEKVALLDLHGVIKKNYGSSSLLSSTPGPDPVSDLTESLDRAARDSDVKAVVLRVDSPGGYVSWSDVLYREVREFKKTTKKPVVACITGLGASGGYYVALAADRICAAPTATVGSIGVIAFFLNVEGLASKIGVEVQVVKSGDKKDMGAPWRSMNDKEKKIVQGMIDEFYERFVGLTCKRRKDLTREEVIEVADGRLFTAKQALASGLIDEVAYLDQAVFKARELAGLEDAKLITYRRSYEYKDNIYSKGGQRPSVNLINLDPHELLGQAHSGFYYLWLPQY